jgi:hypothetical protein
MEKKEDVQTRSIVDHDHQNTPKDLLDSLRNIAINDHNDHAAEGSDGTHEGWDRFNPLTAEKGDLIETKYLRNLDRYLFKAVRNCICFADCTYFVYDNGAPDCACNSYTPQTCKCNSYKKPTCSCQSYRSCGCIYW